MVHVTKVLSELVNVCANPESPDLLVLVVQLMECLVPLVYKHALNLVFLTDTATKVFMVMVGVSVNKDTLVNNVKKELAQ